MFGDGEHSRARRHPPFGAGTAAVDRRDRGVRVDGSCRTAPSAARPARGDPPHQPRGTPCLSHLRPHTSGPLPEPQFLLCNMREGPLWTPQPGHHPSWLTDPCAACTAGSLGNDTWTPPGTLVHSQKFVLGEAGGVAGGRSPTWNPPVRGWRRGQWSSLQKDLGSALEEQVMLQKHP